MKIAKTYTSYKPEAPAAEYVTVLDSAVDLANDQLLPDLSGSPVVLVLGMDNVEVFGFDAIFGRLDANDVSKPTTSAALAKPADGHVRLVYKLGGVEGCCDVPIEA